MSTCVSVVYFTGSGNSSKKGHSKLEKTCKKQKNNLSTKLIKS